MNSAPLRHLKSAKHHWWPQALSAYWEDGDGKACQLGSNGDVVRSNPAQFGAITNAHHIKLAADPAPWDRSFESAFQRADDRMASLVQQLALLDSGAPQNDATMDQRLQPQVVRDSLIADVSMCAISLVVRGPQYRQAIRSATIDIQRRMGMKQPDVRDSLVAANISGCFERFTAEIDGRGKWLVMFSDEREFVFGDGFLHNFTSRSVAPLNPRFLFALTPTIALLYFRPMRYPSRPRLMTLRVERSEVDLVNAITLAYSCDYVFYRSEQPALSTAFASGQHLQLENHSHAWIDGVTNSMLNFHDPERRGDEVG